MESNKFEISSHLRKITSRENESALVYHSLFGNPRILNKEGLRFLWLFREAIEKKETKKFIEGDSRELTQEFSKDLFITPEGFNERKVLEQQRKTHLKRFTEKKTIEHISLSVSNVCNFGCAHCMFFQRDKNGKLPDIYNSQSSLKMPWEIAKRCMDFYIALLKEIGSDKGRIHFGNAEPLLNRPIIEKALDYCEDKSRQEGISFEYAINSNLWALDERMAETLKRYKVGIATSLDGLKEANDIIRITKGGKGTFSRILDKINLLERIGYPLTGISITVAEKNFYLVDTEMIDFAHERKMKSVAFDYDLINCLDVPTEQMINKVLKMKAYAEERGIYFDGTWGTPFRRLISKSLLRNIYSFCAAVEGSGLTFNPDGGIKACDYSLNNVGHIDQIEQIFKESSHFYNLVKSRFPGNDSHCRDCEIEGFCGQCQITREVAGRTKQNLTEVLCKFYKGVTRALLKEVLEKNI